MLSAGCGAPCSTCRVGDFMDDDKADDAGNRIVDQIILRALLREFVKRLALLSDKPEQAIREIGESLQDFVNGYHVPGCDERELERAKERARMNLDTLIESFPRIG
jgi:hypothetical protein